MIIVDHFRFIFFPVKVSWFNSEKKPDIINFGIHRFRQSVKHSSIPSKYRIRETKFKTIIIDLRLSKAELYSKLHKTTRTEVNKVSRMIKNNANISIKHNYKIDEFVEMANKYIICTGYREKITAKELLHYIDNNKGELLSLYYNNILIVCIFCLTDMPERVRVLCGYNNRFSSNGIEKQMFSCFTRYLHWYAISDYYKNSHFLTYDFGGIDLNPNSDKSGIARFKQGFGGKVVVEYDYEYATNMLIGKLYAHLKYKKEFRCKK
jgi:hypothetical protein